MIRLLKPPRSAKACANCIHFARNGTAYVYRPVDGIYRMMGEQVRGDCRAKPPGRDRKTGDALWPDVVGNDWCSAFARLEKKAVRLARETAQRSDATFDEPNPSFGGAA